MFLLHTYERNEMPNRGYSFAGLDDESTAKTSGRDLRVSPKAAREICHTLKRMWLRDARRLLQDVVEKRRPIPYRRHRKEVAHRAGIDGWYAGRYPVKAAQVCLRLLDSLEANAEHKGLDIERLRIVHAAAQRARVLKRYIPRAFGRSSPDFERLCHIELAVREVV